MDILGDPKIKLCKETSKSDLIGLNKNRNFLDWPRIRLIFAGIEPVLSQARKIMLRTFKNFSREIK